MGGDFHNSFWVVAALFPILILLVLEAMKRKKKLWLYFPRIIWISGVLFLVADLNFTSSREWSQPGMLYVFYDQSDSVMRIPERRKNLKKYLSEIQEWAKNESQPVEVFSFGDELQKAGFDFVKGQGSRSLIEPVSKILNDKDASSIIISDGNWDDYSKMPTRSFSVSLDEGGKKDLWVEKVQPVMTAFLKNRLTIPVEIGQSGYDGQEVRVELYRGLELLTTKNVRMEEASARLDFSFFPEKMGEDILLVRVRPEDDELSDLNNQVSIRIRTVRDKIRILHISGKPSIDLKAWRLFLTRQPDVDLVSFYILRSLDDDPQARNDELSLIPFPYEDLFTTELDKFDIVILQNFNFNLYFQPFYLMNLAAFVRGGGSLLMMGGDQSYHRYKLSPLTNTLPFSFAEGAGYESGEYKVKMSAKHPLTKGLGWAFETPKWSRRHKLVSIPEATDLARFSDGIPFLSIRELGQGRVMVLNSDETWRFQFEPYGKFVPMGRFARRALQYLTFDPEMEERGLTSTAWNSGQKVSLSLTSESKANWNIRPLKIDSKDSAVFQNTNEVSYLVPDAGTYEVRVSELSDTKLFETEEKPWLREWKDLLTNEKKLSQLALQSGGRYFNFSEREQVFEQKLTGKQIISAEISPWLRASKTLSWLVLLGILIFMSLDFFLRKKQQWDT